MQRAMVVWMVLAAACAGACTGEKGELKLEGGERTALVFEDSDSTTVLFATNADHEELSTVVDGAVPMGFAWISVRVPSATAENLYKDSGLVADLAEPDSGVTFSQVYRDVCNPAIEDYSPCWLFERYSAGDTGVSGTLEVRLTGATARGRFNVIWEGMTDRFGEPTQWLGRETSAGFDAISLGDVR